MDPRRKHPRFSCDLPCRILTAGSVVVDASVVNVSLEGVYLVSELMMDEGSRFELEIEAGGPDPISVEAELVHWRYLRPPDDEDEAEPVMGYGVRISPPPPDFAELVADLAARSQDTSD